MVDKLRSTVILTLLGMWMTGAAHAQQPEPIVYTLGFPNPHTHYVRVQAVVPTEGRSEIELMMAVWTPGSYLIREFARHVEGIEARTLAGEPLRIQKTRKNRWLIETAGVDRITVSYMVYGREMSVRTNWIEADFAMINGAPTFLTLADETTPRPHDVVLELPPAWSRGLTGLAPYPDRGPLGFRAQDFDTLVDSPIIAGNPAIYEFTVEGTAHLLVNIGEGGVWNGTQSATDIELITRELHRMWGTMPYDRYLFFNMITEAGGGLEHRNSTLLMSSRWATGSRDSYLRWLQLASHEAFHAWNVKRLRPVELGPFDYETEVHTENLWMVEGLTSYYGDLIVHRAGLSSEEEYLQALSREIQRLQTTPGREVQPVTLASYDSWIKFYRGDENSVNTSISYYTKGAVIGFLLDMRIRAATNGVRTLDDVMRLAFERYSGARGFTTTEFQNTAQELAGVDLGAWFTLALETTNELDYQEALAWLGLEFSTETENEERGWIGLITRNYNGRLVIAQVRRNTPAHTAGLNVDDEILAIGNHRVLPGEIDERLSVAQPSSELSLLISRRGTLMRVPVIVETEPADNWELQLIENPTPAQVRHREAWLAGS